MAEPDDFDRLASSETQFQHIAKRADRKLIASMAVGFPAGLFLVALVVGGRPIDALPLAPLASGAVGAVIAIALLRRVVPDVSRPASIMGVTRRKRWGIYRALWHRQPVATREELALVEELAYKMRRGLPLVLGSFVLMTWVPVWHLIAGSTVLPQWFLWAQLSIVPAIVSQQIWFIRRSAVVARLTRAQLDRGVA